MAASQSALDQLRSDCNKLEVFITNEICDGLVKNSARTLIRELNFQIAAEERRNQSQSLNFRVKLPQGSYYTLEGLDPGVSCEEIQNLLFAEVGEQFGGKMSLSFSDGQPIRSQSFRFAQSHVDLTDNAIHLIASSSSIPSSELPATKSFLSQILSSSSQSIPLSSSFDYMCLSIHLQMISNGFKPIQVTKSRPGFAPAMRQLPTGHLVDLDAWNHHPEFKRIFLYQDGGKVEIVFENGSTAIIMINDTRKIVIPVNGGVFTGFDEFIDLNSMQLNDGINSPINTDEDMFIGPNHAMFQPHIGLIRSIPGSMTIDPLTGLAPPIRPGRMRIFGSDPDPDHARPPFI